MAKTMAVLNVSEVVNIIWCEDNTPDTDTMVSTNGKPVQIGDHYEAGKFYRNGQPVLTDLEQLEQQHLEEIAALIEEIYQEDLEMIDE